MGRRIDRAASADKWGTSSRTHSFPGDGDKLGGGVESKTRIA